MALNSSSIKFHSIFGIWLLFAERERLNSPCGAIYLNHANKQNKSKLNDQHNSLFLQLIIGNIELLNGFQKAQAAKAWGQWGLSPTNSKGHGGIAPIDLRPTDIVLFFSRFIRWLQAQPSQRSHLQISVSVAVVTGLRSSNNQKNMSNHHASCSKLCLLCMLIQLKKT